MKKLLLKKAMTETMLKTYKDWTKEQWAKVFFNDETQSLYRVRKVSAFNDHPKRRFINQFVNIRRKRCFSDTMARIDVLANTF